jgi:hypothetical protein
MASYVKHPAALALASTCVAFYLFTRVIHILSGYEQARSTAPERSSSTGGNGSRGSEPTASAETRRVPPTARDAA